MTTTTADATKVELLNESGIPNPLPYAYERADDFEAPDSCDDCAAYFKTGDLVKEVLVDFDAGNPEVGPMPNVGIALVHFDRALCAAKRAEAQRTDWF